MKFKNDRQRKAVMTNINKYGVTLKKSKGWPEPPDPRTGKALGHQLAALKANAKKAYNKPLSKPMIFKNQPLELVLRKAGRFAVPLMFSLSGMDDPLIVAKAGLNSFEDSLKKYKETENIDDAVISGVKSFVKNYIIDKADNYMASNFSLLKDGDNGEYEAALKGTILITSLYAIRETIK